MVNESILKSWYLPIPLFTYQTLEPIVTAAFLSISCLSDPSVLPWKLSNRMSPPLQLYYQSHVSPSLCSTTKARACTYGSSFCFPISILFILYPIVHLWKLELVLTAAFLSILCHPYPIVQLWKIELVLTAAFLSILCHPYPIVQLWKLELVFTAVS